MTDNQIRNDVIKLLHQAEPANQNYPKHLPAYITIISIAINAVAVAFAGLYFYESTPVNVAELYQIDSLIKNSAECQHKSIASLRAALKKEYNIYSFDKITKFTAHKIINHLQNRQCNM